MSSGYLELLYRGESVHLYLRERGTGQLILFVHGWNHSGEIWAKVTQRLSGSYRMITVDLPGFGRSPALKPVNICIQEYANILGLAVKRLNSKNQPAVAIGDSFGAVLLVHLLQRGDLDNFKLLLIGCPYNGMPKSLRVLSKYGLISSSLSLLQLMPLVMSQPLIRRISLATVSSLAKVDDAIVQGVLSADPLTSEAIFRQICRPISLKRPLINAIPTVVTRGEADRIISRSASRQLAVELGAVYTEIPESGHTPMIENPEALTDCIYTLLNSEGGTTGG